MTDQPSSEESLPKLDKSRVGAAGNQITAPKMPPDDAAASTADVSEASKALSADEQMALYEKELKENDWGHQPC